MTGFFLGVLFSFALVVWATRGRLDLLWNRPARGRKRVVLKRRVRGTAYSFTSVQQDVVEALVGQGVRRRSAVGTVRLLGAEMPDASFEVLFMKAVAAHVKPVVH